MKARGCLCVLISLGLRLASWVKHPSVVGSSHTFCFLFLNFCSEMIIECQGVAEPSTEKSFVPFSPFPPVGTLCVDCSAGVTSGNPPWRTTWAVLCCFPGCAASCSSRYPQATALPHAHHGGLASSHSHGPPAPASRYSRSLAATNVA